MEPQFRLYRRSNGGRFYLHNNLTGKQESLGTTDRTEAARLLYAKNEASRHPLLNVQIARAYLAANDTQVGTRNWQDVMNEITKSKKASTLAFYKILPTTISRLTQSSTFYYNSSMRCLFLYLKNQETEAILLPSEPLKVLVEDNYCFQRAHSPFSEYDYYRDDSGRLTGFDLFTIGWTDENHHAFASPFLRQNRNVEIYQKQNVRILWRPVSTLVRESVQGYGDGVFMTRERDVAICIPEWADWGNLGFPIHSDTDVSVLEWL